MCWVARRRGVSATSFLYQSTFANPLTVHSILATRNSSSLFSRLGSENWRGWVSFPVIKRSLEMEDWRKNGVSYFYVTVRGLAASKIQNNLSNYCQNGPS